MTTINNETKVRALLAAGKSSEAILDYLVMNDDYRTKAEARPILEAFMAENNLTKVKSKPMSEQYEDWYRALPLAEKRTIDKNQLRTKAVEIGMSEKSADWYARVYALAGALALSIYDEANQAPKPEFNEDSAELLPDEALADDEAPAKPKRGRKSTK